MYFCYFVTIYPWKRAWPFIWKKYFFPFAKDVCAKFEGWNLQSGSGEDFLNFVNTFLLFRYCLPKGKDVALHLNELESPSPKDALCHIWLKLAQWFWRKSRNCKKGRTNRQTPNATWSKKLTDFSFQLKWAKKEEKNKHYYEAKKKKKKEIRHHISM